MARKVKAGSLEIDIGLGLATLSQDLKKLTGTLDKEFNKIKKLGSILTGVFAGGAALYGLKRFTDAIRGLADAGDAAGDIKQAFIALGGSSSSLEQARQATMGLVDSFELMRLANVGLLKQLPDFNENFAQIAELATRWSQAVGGSAEEAMAKLINAIASGKQKALSDFGIYVDKSASLAKKQLQAMEQLSSAMENLPPIGIGVNDAFQVLSVTLKEAYTNIGLGVDSSEDLKNSLIQLAATLSAVDWESFGRGLASIAAALGSLAEIVLPPVIDKVKELGFALRFLFSDDAEAKAARLKDQIEGVKETLLTGDVDTGWLGQLGKKLSSTFGLEGQWSIGAKLGSMIMGQDKNLEGNLLNQLAALEKEYADLMSGVSAEQKKNDEDWAKRVEEMKKKYADLFQTRLKQGDKAAKKEQEQLQKLSQEYDKFAANVEANNLNKLIQKALQSGDVQAFEQLKEKFLKATEEGIRTGYEEALSSNNPAMREQAEKNIQQQVDAVEGQLGEQFQTAMEERYQNSVDFWQNAFENAITGATFDLEDALKQVAIGFAAQMAAALVGSPGGNITSLKQFGGVIAQQLFGVGGTAGGGGGGSLLSGILGGAGGASIWDAYENFGSFTAGASGEYLPGAAGAATPEAYAAAQMGEFASGAAGAGAIYLSLSELADVGSDTAESVEGVTTALGALGGYLLGGPWGALGGAVAGKVGGGFLGDLFGTSVNPETQARRDVVGWLEDRLAEAQKKGMGLSIFTEEGVKPFGGWLQADKQFSGAGWADALGTESGQVFDALGQALTRFLGITEDVGSQVGLILQQNLLGNLDNARLMLQSLGVSVEELSAAVLEMAKTGEITWQQWAIQTQNLSKLQGEGLIAIGNLQGAYDQLSASGGAGMDAIIALQNLAIEATDLNIASVEELGTALVEQGILSQEQWDEFFNILISHGIDTMEELKNASIETLGGVVADLDTNVKLFEEWKQQVEDMKQGVEDLSSAWEEVPTEWSTDYIINVKYEEENAPPAGADDITAEALGGIFDKNGLVKFGKGGVVTRPTMFRFGAGSLGLMGEAGPEAILPLERAANGKLGVAGAGGATVVNFNIDARGGTPGIETQILRAISSVGRRAAKTAVREIRRGGRI